MSQDCECKVMTHPIDNRHGYIEFCALHRAAPALVEALEASQGYLASYPEVYQMVKHALTLAEQP